jgi:hypothetical protein
MPVTCTKIQWLAKGNSADSGSGGAREVRPYLVEFAETGATPSDALNAKIMSGETVVAQVPPDLSEHPSYPAMKVTAKRAEPLDEARRKFVVVVTWSVPEISWGAGESNPGGTDVKWNKNISVSGIEIPVLTNTTADGKPLVNSFGDLMGDVETTIYDELITISHNSDVVPSSTIAALRGKVNASDITLTITKGGVTRTATYPAKTLKVGNVTYDIDIDSSGAGSFKIVIPLICRSRFDKDGNQIGWQAWLTDKGFRYKDSTGAKVIKSDVEVCLDGTGKKVAGGAEQHKLTFDIETAADITPLLAGYLPEPPPEP